MGQLLVRDAGYKNWIGWTRVVTNLGLPQIWTCGIDASGSSEMWIRYVGRRFDRTA